jgi:hypothetical protein
MDGIKKGGKQQEKIVWIVIVIVCTCMITCRKYDEESQCDRRKKD